MPTFGIFNDIYVHIDMDIYEYISVRFGLAKSTPQTEMIRLLSACEILKLNQTVVYIKTKPNLKLGSV